MKYQTVSGVIIASLCTTSTAQADSLWELSTACETELALTGGPAYMREKAGVYTLGKDGYEKVRDSENGFVCMVTREGENSVVPQCFDRIGQQVHMTVHLDEAKKLRAGMAREDVRKERAQGFFNGTYSSAKGHGVVYMASDYNLVNFSGRLTRIAPHVMYHAPGVSNEDLGSVPPEAFKNKGMPFIANSGPMGFMISFTERATDSSGADAACKGELPDLSKYAPFPPQ